MTVSSDDSIAALEPSDEPVVGDLQRECLKRSAELSALVDALLDRVRAKRHELAPAPATPPPAAAAAEPLNDGDTPKAVRRVLAEADEWLVGAESLAERSDAPAQPAYAADGAASSGRDGEPRSDGAVWEHLWHPTAEAAIASARQGEAEALRQLADLRQQLAQGQEEPTGVRTHSSVRAQSEGAATRHELASADAEALDAAASAASAAFSTLSAAASGSDPNDPRDAVTGAAAGVEDAVRSLRELFLQWAPMLQLQVFSPAAEQSALSRGDIDSASSEDVVLVDLPG